MFFFTLLSVAVPDSILKPSATPAAIAIPAVSETASPEAAALGPTTLLEYFSPVKGKGLASSARKTGKIIIVEI